MSNRKKGLFSKKSIYFLHIQIFKSIIHEERQKKFYTSKCYRGDFLYMKVIQILFDLKTMHQKSLCKP